MPTIADLDKRIEKLEERVHRHGGLLQRYEGARLALLGLVGLVATTMSIVGTLVAFWIKG